VWVEVLTMRSSRIAIALLLVGMVVADAGPAVARARKHVRRHRAAAAAVKPADVGPGGSAMTDRQRTDVVESLMANPVLAGRWANQRVRVLRVHLDESKDAPERRLVTATVMNYSRGRATRATLDLTSGEASEAPLRGRPQASPEEVAEAASIVGSDPAHVRLLGDGRRLGGGFIVDPPSGVESPDGSAHRFLQLHVLSPDRSRIEHVVTVDLTSGTIAAVQRF
jgi:hypothetical protein